MASSSGIDDILRDMAVPESVINKFMDEKVTKEVVHLMTDEQLCSLGLRAVGLQVLLRSRCSGQRPESNSSAETVKVEKAKLFAPYQRLKGDRGQSSNQSSTKRKRKRAVSSSYVKFFVLPLCTSNALPTGKSKSSLHELGLGEHVVRLDEDAEIGDIKTALEESCPKLKDGGGFDILKAERGEKRLSVLVPPKNGFSLQYLRSLSRTCIFYVRPIQKDLDMSTTVEETDDQRVVVNDVLVDCINCSKSFSMSSMKRHRESCGSNGSRPSVIYPDGQQLVSDEEVVIVAEPIDSPATTTSTGDLRAFLRSNELPHMRPTGRLTNTHTATSGVRPRPSTTHPADQPSEPSTSGTQPRSASYRSYVQQCIDDMDLSSDDEDCTIMSVAIMENIQANKLDELPLSEILKTLTELIEEESSSKFNVNRAQLWECAVRGFRRVSFRASNRLSVHFTDSIGTMEGAIDEGGPRREFLTLLRKALQESVVFEGQLDNRVLSLNSKALNQGLYKIAGMMAAVIVVHGSIKLGFLSKTTFHVMAYGYTAKANPDDIPDYEVKAHIESILGATSLEALTAATEQASALISMAGCFRAIKAIEEKDSLARDLTRFYLIDRARSAYESFFEGMEALGVLQSVRQHPKAWEECFCNAQEELSSEILEKLFKYELTADADSNRRKAENSTVAFWLDLLLDIQDGASEVSFDDILMFTTGLNRIPITGFHLQPKIEFLHEAESGEAEPSKFPKAQTCSYVLKLPIHGAYETFKEKMEFGILSAHGFGFA